MVTPPPVAPPVQAAMPKRRWWIPLLVVAGLVSVGVIGASYLQVPYVAYAPGDARPTSPRISIDGEKTYPVDGQMLFVTVGLPRLTALGWLVGKLDPSKVDVFTEKQVYGDQSESESRQENLKLMTYSKDFAAYVALEPLGYPGKVEHGGADALTPGELSGGVEVAATGTISPTGEVGEIGGLKQKTIAVMRTGAKVFLVPEAEKAEAEAAAKGSDLKIVGVNTLDDALKELATL